MSLYQIAQDEVSKTPDIEASVAAVHKRLTADDTLMKEALERAARGAVYEARRTAKIGVKRSCGAPSQRSVADAAGAVTSALLERWTMPDGRMLGDWTGPELLAQVSTERAQAAGHERNASFYQALAQKAGAKSVREKVSSEQAEQLWRNVSKTIEGAVA